MSEYKIGDRIVITADPEDDSPQGYALYFADGRTGAEVSAVGRMGTVVETSITSAWVMFAGDGQTLLVELDGGDGLNKYVRPGQIRKAGSVSYRLLDGDGILCEETDDLAVVGSFVVSAVLNGEDYRVEVVDEQGRQLKDDGEGNLVLAETE